MRSGPTSNQIPLAAPLNPFAGVIVTPGSDIRGAIRAEVAKVLAEIPPDKTGAIVAVATPRGVNLAVAAKTAQGWEVAAWIGKSWGQGSAVDYGAQVKKTW